MIFHFHSSGIQTLMEKLEHCNHIPLFNNPSIVCEKPQLQLLYDELSSMIQTLFIYHDLQKVSDLNKRLICAAEVYSRCVCLQC
ncbi:hypothetical protein Hanom_Chr16g01475651 [Helianthus anomalus]